MNQRKIVHLTRSLGEEVCKSLALRCKNVVVDLKKCFFYQEIKCLNITSKLLLFFKHMSLIFIWKMASPLSLV